jgi:filamentous hemagglutinin family protein
LGLKGPVKGPHYIIESQWGQQYGSNLFHSFGIFDLKMNESVTFLGPENTNNIISRITGNHVSHINGKLRSLIPNADIYLINPKGFIFGSHASLEVQGSFHASTADVLHLQDGGRFDVSQPHKSLLTTASIAAFGFLTNTPTSIVIEESKLSVPKNQNLSFIGGNLYIGTKSSHPQQHNKPLTQLSAKSGNINLNSIANRTEGQLGSITLENAEINTSGENGGKINIKTGHLILNDSIVKTEVQGSQHGKGINIQAQELTIRAGRLSSTTIGSGAGGDINVEITGIVNLVGDNTWGSTGIFSDSGRDDNKNAGKAGNIFLKAERLEIEGGAWLTASTYGSGNSGDIIIQVEETTNITGEVSGIYSETYGESNEAGKSGTINLMSENLYLTNGSQINTSTYGGGQGGNISISVKEKIIISGPISILASNSESGGNAGSIELEVKELTIKNNSAISAESLGQGKAGNIHIEIVEDTILSDSFISTYTNEGGGKIMLKTKGLKLKDGSIIGASTVGEGQGGDIKIQANYVSIKGDSKISADSGGQGNAGSIEIKAEGIIRIQNSIIQTETTKADGGNIKINSPNFLYLMNSDISTSVKAENGNGGNIALAPEFIILDNGHIIAQAIGGDGGSIDIATTSIYQFSDKPIEEIINASSDLGIDGIVTIDSPDINIEKDLVTLPNTFVDASQRIKRCIAHVLSERSHFYIRHLPIHRETLDDLKPSRSLLARTNLFETQEIQPNLSPQPLLQLTQLAKCQ